MTATVFSISRSSDFILEGKVFDLALLQREAARSIWRIVWQRDRKSSPRFYRNVAIVAINYLPDYLSAAQKSSANLRSQWTSFWPDEINAHLRRASRFWTFWSLIGDECRAEVSVKLRKTNCRNRREVTRSLFLSPFLSVRVEFAQIRMEDRISSENCSIR